jgi:hypothetical protein
MSDVRQCVIQTQLFQSKMYVRISIKNSQEIGNRTQYALLNMNHKIQNR